MALFFGDGLSFRRFRQGTTSYIWTLAFEVGLALFLLGLFLAAVMDT